MIEEDYHSSTYFCSQNQLCLILWSQLLFSFFNYQSLILPHLPDFLHSKAKIWKQSTAFVSQSMKIDTTFLFLCSLWTVLMPFCKHSNSSTQTLESFSDQGLSPSFGVVWSSNLWGRDFPFALRWWSIWHLEWFRSPSSSMGLGCDSQSRMALSPSDTKASVISFENTKLCSWEGMMICCPLLSSSNRSECQQPSWSRILRVKGIPVLDLCERVTWGEWNRESWSCLSANNR